jgi:hypothetical protein
MNNEPVAWYWEEKQIVDLKRGSGKLDKVFGTPIPLYTHPAQTLTDGEIVKIFQTTGFWQNSDLVHETDAIEFARAILKKASDK